MQIPAPIITRSPHGHPKPNILIGHKMIDRLVNGLQRHAAVRAVIVPAVKLAKQDLVPLLTAIISQRAQAPRAEGFAGHPVIIPGVISVQILVRGKGPVIGAVRDRLIFKLF